MGTERQSVNDEDRWIFEGYEKPMHYAEEWKDDQMLARYESPHAHEIWTISAALETDDAETIAKYAHRLVRRC